MPPRYALDISVTSEKNDSTTFPIIWTMKRDPSGSKENAMARHLPLRIRRATHEAVSCFWRYEWPIVAILGLGALILGFVGFKRADGSLSVWDALYRDLQLIVLESGRLEGQSVPWELEVARLLVPLVAAYVGLKGLAAIFREQVGLLLIRLVPHRVVVCGLGQRGFLIARSLRERGERVVVIEKNGNNELIEPCRRAGTVVLIGDATDAEVLRGAQVHRARHLISVCRDDRTNAEVAIRARQLATRRTSGALTCVVHVLDPQLSALLKAYEIGEHYREGFRLDCFNVFESGARALLREYPPFGEQDLRAEEPHLAVIGLGRLGQSLLVQAARGWRVTGRRADERLRVTVLDTQAGAKTSALLSRYPQLSQACHLIPREVDVESPEFERADFLFDSQGRCDVTQVYLCLDDDSLGVAAALKLYQHLREHRVPIVVCMARDTGLTSLLEEELGVQDRFETLHGFGLLEQTCHAELLLGGTYEILARAIHEEYVRLQEEEGQTPVSNPAMVPWDELPETLKESNRAQAGHIGAKLKAVGCGIIPWADWEAESFEFTPGEVELLSKMEHERWVDERRRNGWTYAPGAKNVEKKTSPYMVSWEELREEIKEWDRVTVRGLPAFLAKADLQIVRLRPGDATEKLLQ
jgi:hypothetical protein